MAKRGDDNVWLRRQVLFSKGFSNFSLQGMYNSQSNEAPGMVKKVQKVLENRTNLNGVVLL